MKVKSFMRLASLLMIAMVSFSLVSCSNDDEPKEDASTIYESLKLRLFDTDGTPAFDELDGQFYYYTVINDKEAKEYCESLIGKEIQKDDFVYTLPGEYGNLRFVKAESEGIFYYVFVTLKDQTQFSINICHPEILNDDNAWVNLKNWPR